MSLSISRVIRRSMSLFDRCTQLLLYNWSSVNVFIQQHYPHCHAVNLTRNSFKYQRLATPGVGVIKTKRLLAKSFKQNAWLWMAGASGLAITTMQSVEMFCLLNACSTSCTVSHTAENYFYIIHQKVIIHSRSDSSGSSNWLVTLSHGWVITSSRKHKR